MQHWAPEDRDRATPASLPSGADVRLRPRRARQAPPHVGSLIGLALAVAMLVGLALLLAPNAPVSPRLG